MTHVSHTLPVEILRNIIEIGGCYGRITKISLEIERWRRLYSIFRRDKKVELIDEYGQGDYDNLTSDILFFIAHHHVRFCSGRENKSLIIYPCETI